MNLEKLIKKYLGEWLDSDSRIRMEYYCGRNVDANLQISFYWGANETYSSTEVWCGDLEKGLELIRERLQKK